ncbi:MAG: hypothetical protein R3C14_02790 [Caldilineaceae bacterium]
MREDRKNRDYAACTELSLAATLQVNEQAIYRILLALASLDVFTKVNDSIALKQAQVSVSIAGAATVATDTAQIVLMDGTLAQLDTLFDLSARYESDLHKQYILGVYIPAGYIAGTLLWGWGMVSSYVVGYIVFLTATGLAFRPIWRQERLEAKSQIELNAESTHQRSLTETTA